MHDILRESMELGGRHLLGWLDPERDYLPTGSWLITHDLARLWDALLRLEDATGFVIPGHLEGAMLRNLHWLCDNPDGLLFVPPGLDWLTPSFELHSVREGILTFNALVQYRNSRWAREAGRRYVETLTRCVRSDGRWDPLKFDYARHFKVSDEDSFDEVFTHANGPDLTVSHGRSIEALVWYYRSTGDELALDLAQRLADYHLAHSTSADGSIPGALASKGNQGDRQSFLYTLCGLLQFGLLTHQHQYVDAVSRTYRRAIPELVNECGWVAHDLGQLRFPDESGNPLANTESTGAAVRLALWLALHTGRAELFDDVERLLRARIFPGQSTEADLESSSNDPISAKQLGGWGANLYPHAGKGYNPSGTAEIVHTLCAVRQHICARSEAGLVVYLHFNYTDDNVEIVSRRHKGAATVTVRPRVLDNLQLRVPRWAPRETLRLSVDGRPYPLRQIGDFAFVPSEALQAGKAFVLGYELPPRRTAETMPNGDRFQFAWQGDEITGVYPNRWPLPFYPTLEDPDDV